MGVAVGFFLLSDHLVTTTKMSGKIQKSYTTQDPVLAYCNNSSSPLHPVQQKLIDETVQHNRGRMMAAAESINLNALLIRSHNAKKVLFLTMALSLDAMLAKTSQQGPGNIG